MEIFHDNGVWSRVGRGPGWGVVPGGAWSRVGRDVIIDAVTNLSTEITKLCQRGGMRVWWATSSKN